MLTQAQFAAWCWQLGLSQETGQIVDMLIWLQKSQFIKKRRFSLKELRQRANKLHETGINPSQDNIRPFMTQPEHLKLAELRLELIHIQFKLGQTMAVMFSGKLLDKELSPQCQSSYPKITLSTSNDYWVLMVKTKLYFKSINLFFK